MQEQLNEFYIIKQKDKPAYLSLSNYSNFYYLEYIENFLEKYRYSEDKKKLLYEFFKWQKNNLSLMPNTWRKTIDGAHKFTHKTKMEFENFLKEGAKYLSVKKDLSDFYKKISISPEFIKSLTPNDIRGSYKAPPATIEDEIKNFYDHSYGIESMFLFFNSITKALLKEEFEYQHINKLEENFQTSGFVVYSSSGNQAGYLDAQKNMGSLNTARIFPNKNLAIDFVEKGRGARSADYAILELDVCVKKITENKYKKGSPDLILKTQALVEKNEMKAENFQKMEDKLKDYERILIQNNLLPETKEKKAKML